MAKIPEAEKRAKSESDSDEEESDGSSSEEGSSESGSESESEQKQPSVAKKPSSLPPAAAKKTKSLVQKPSEKSESESESGSGSGSDSDESEPEVEQVAPKPTADPPKSKSVAKKPNPPKPAAASTVTPPTKSTAKKRAAEDKQSAAKDSKKLKTDPENSEASSKDETKKQLFHRLWNEDDEIALLKGLADYKQKKKADPYAELDSFHLFIGENLHVEVTKARLQDKIRRLKKKYETNKTKDQPNKDKSFSKPHEKKIYELSEPVWGNVEKAIEKSASVKKTRGKSVNVVENGESDDAKNEKNVVENGESDDVKNEKSVDVVSGDVEKGVATTGSNYSTVENRISRMGTEMYEGADNGTELQKQWRKLRVKEMEIHMMKLELMRDQTKLVLDGICNGSTYLFRPSLPILVTDFGKTKRCRIACGSTTNENWGISTRQEYQNTVDELYCSDNYKHKLDNVRSLLVKSTEEENLILVDAIQRLGMGRHYQEEIHTILAQYYAKKTGDSDTTYGCYSLHDVSLLFRLLRQQGYDVSPEVFNNFKGENGKFRGELRQDITGLLELYEAKQLSFEGEKILDEAEDFSTKLLHRYSADCKNRTFANRIITRLTHPCHKTITRLTEKNFLTDFGTANNGWEKPLKELAEVDFLVGKSVYQEELLQVSKWWDGLGLTRELKLARNQPLKWYTWSMAILINDIRLSKQRIELTKSIAFIYLIDDIFDLYGTPDELAIFTEAVDKWDYAAIDKLPEYMKMSYKALLDTINEIARMIFEKHGHNPINTLKETWASLCKAFLVEGKWFADGEYLPSAEEYLSNGKVSSGVHVVLVHLFYILGFGGTHNQGAILLEQNSTLISSVAAILRLSDDFGNAKDEQQNGKDGSYIEYYMRDNHGVSFKQAREHVINMIASEWKLLNKECFDVNHYSPTLSFYREACLNLARMVPLMYSYDDNQKLPILEEYVDLMLLKPKSSEHHMHI